MSFIRRPGFHPDSLKEAGFGVCHLSYCPEKERQMSLRQAGDLGLERKQVYVHSFLTLGRCALWETTLCSFLGSNVILDFYSLI